MITKIRTEKEYKAVMKTIESLLEKATAIGGFHELAKEEAMMLSTLSELAEAYEDNTLKLMPIKPNTLRQAIEYKMAELGLSQANLAEVMGISAPKLSQILSGKREPDVSFLKAAHEKLNIDAEFLLTHV
ncbi:helix-turn-helix domain-containing protein [Pararhodonellum marinum]|uniref:helix-turn-helix domain-containing protein n=1 Tax=Pararhodonellum marinum TaxID=2755358 RepID=UPI00188F8CC7|nr:helix-turn-helix domain-containing protein [Pararhodonellum marinum]